MAEERVSKFWIDEIPPGPTARIIQRILPMMPTKGVYYTEEQARWMESRMNEIVDEEFKKEREKYV